MPCPFQWLVITDGTTDDAGIRNQIDLVSPSGFCVLEDGDWQPAITEPKGGGVWRDSQLAEGRRPADFKAANVNEAMTLTVSALDQDALIRDTQNLRRLLNKARTYGTTRWQDEPVWIEAQSPGESEMRYAVIWNYSTPNDGNPYEEPFFQTVARAGMSDFVLGLEREPYWRADEPGAASNVPISAMETYNAITFGNIDSACVREPVTADTCYIVGQRSTAQLTDVRTGNTGVGWNAGNEINCPFPGPFNFYQTPANVDFVAFGIDAAVGDAGPFNSLVFDIGTALAGAGCGVTWEYWRNGPAWAGLTVVDHTVGFTVTGVHSVHWIPPANWEEAIAPTPAAGAPNAGYWVRAIVAGCAGAPVSPTQQNRNNYAVTWPYIEVQAADIAGDVPAILQMRVHNLIDPITLTTVSNRVIMGLRSMSRGAAFTAYLNCANEQNPAGVTMATGGSSAYTSDETAPAGWRVTYNPAGVEALAARFTWSLDNTISTHFYGRYHAYIRSRQTGGAAGDIEVGLRMNVGIATNTVTLWTTPLAAFTTVADGWQLLDMGLVTIPGGQINTDEVYDSFDLVIMASNTNAAPGDAYFYDLILIPVDEWAGDFSGGFDNEEDYFLYIDGIARPKTTRRADIRTADANERILAPYLSVSAGPPILQANSRQRLWFLVSYLDGAETLAVPSIPHSVRVSAFQRYESMRGSR